jgi:hypothetical protein
VIVVLLNMHAMNVTPPFGLNSRRFVSLLQDLKIWIRS